MLHCIDFQPGCRREEALATGSTCCVTSGSTDLCLAVGAPLSSQRVCVSVHFLKVYPRGRVHQHHHRRASLCVGSPEGTGGAVGVVFLKTNRPSVCWPLNDTNAAKEIGSYNYLHSIRDGKGRLFALVGSSLYGCVRLAVIAVDNEGLRL